MKAMHMVTMIFRKYDDQGRVVIGSRVIEREVTEDQCTEVAAELQTQGYELEWEHVHGL